MKQLIELTRQTRRNIFSIIESLEESKVQLIPEGFNNNVAWNVGHIIVTQQLLCYTFANLPLNVSQELVDLFRKGSKPEGVLPYKELISVSDELLDKFLEDCKQNKFANYTPYTTSYGVVLASVEDATAFNNLHEALHLGYIMALARA